MFYIRLSVMSTIHSTSVENYFNAKWMKRSISNYRNIFTFCSIFFFLLSLFNVQVKEPELASNFLHFVCVQLSLCLGSMTFWRNVCAKEIVVIFQNISNRFSLNVFMACMFSKFSHNITEFIDKVFHLLYYQKHRASY